jgi:hypothetical protein
MTIHHTPNINGMGAFEGIQSAVLWRQKIVRNARLALSDLDDETLALVVSDELRRRPALVANRVIGEVTK